MIYWRIRQPGKSWRDWSNGVAGSVDEAKFDAIDSVIDEPWAASGVTVEMWRCIDIDDVHIKPEELKQA